MRKHKIIRWADKSMFEGDTTDEMWFKFFADTCSDDKHAECLDIGACRDGITKGASPSHCRTRLARCCRVCINVEIGKEDEEDKDE